VPRGPVAAFPPEYGPGLRRSESRQPGSLGRVQRSRRRPVRSIQDVSSSSLAGAAVPDGGVGTGTVPSSPAGGTLVIRACDYHAEADERREPDRPFTPP
jgi:hypothetical protein